MKMCKKSSLAVNEGENKDLRLTFDNGITRTMRLPRDKTPGVRSFDYPIESRSMKINVISVYSANRNGFSAVRVWTSGQVQYTRKAR